MKKYKYMISIKLFRFNPNTETLCFGIEAKQPKQTFVSDSTKTSFGCFESKLVSKDTLGRTHSLGGEGVNSSEDARRCSVLYICKYFVKESRGRSQWRRGGSKLDLWREQVTTHKWSQTRSTYMRSRIRLRITTTLNQSTVRRIRKHINLEKDLD